MLRRTFTGLIVGLAVSWCAGLPGDVLSKPVGAAAKAVPLRVIGFTGWVAPTGRYETSSVAAIVDRLKAQGATAEVHPPDDWSSVASRLVARGSTGGPIVLFGYSMGAGAAIHVAEALRDAGIPVARIVVVEAWYPGPLPANIREATHYYSSSLAGRLIPGRGNNGRIRNIDLHGLVPGIAEATHLSMSHLAAVQDIVVSAIEGRAETGVTRGKFAVAPENPKHRR